MGVNASKNYGKSTAILAACYVTDNENIKPPHDDFY